MKKNFIRLISVLCIVAVMLSVTFTSAIAATIYYYFGYYYTYINNDLVSLYGIEAAEFDNVAFIPDTLNSRKLVDIRNNAFKDNTDIRLIEFAGATNLERIGSFAFAGCTNVTGTVSIPSNVVIIETAAFQGVSQIDTLVYDATCGYVPNQCFMNCTALSSVTLNDTVTRIGDYAFANCPNLAYLEIPATVERISVTAFSNDTITLGVYYNSPAYLYAMENGIDYEILDPQNVPTEPVTEPVTQPETTQSVEVTFVLGDADGDGFITILDATKVQRVLADLDDDSDGMITLRAAVDGDVLNIMHATKIQRYLAEFEVAEPIGEEVTRTVTI